MHRRGRGGWRGALAELNPSDRDVLLLTSWAEFDSAEVAEAPGISVGTVPSRPHPIRRRLRIQDSRNTKGTCHELRRDRPRLLGYAADALRSGVLGKEVRAALYEALTTVPGLEITEEEATLDGRVGTALGIEDGTQRQEIIIDPDTGEFIGERAVLSEGSGDLPEGTVLNHSSVTTAVVDDAGDRPVE